MTLPKSFLDRQRDAALEEVRERAAERHRIEDIVIGTDPYRRYGRRMGEVVKLGSDYVVEVHGAVAPWTVVESGKATSYYFPTQEEAALYLFALRHGTYDIAAAYYAARVLGIPRSVD